MIFLFIFLAHFFFSFSAIFTEVNMDMRLLLAVVLSLTLVGAESKRSGARRVTKVQSVQVLGFDWKNCGKPDAPAVLKTVSLSPDPISIPGELTAEASGATSVELSAPLALNVTLEKEVAGFWVKIPCLEELGSCHYENACDLLDQLIPPGQDCPEPLHTYGLPCHCPFKAGSYSLPKSDFYVPKVDLPYWLTNGHYRAQGVLGKDGSELGCLKVALAIHSG